jgi:hypothetical protein
MSDRTPTGAGVEISRLLISAAVTAIAATGGLVVVTVLALSGPDGPPPGAGGPPPPPHQHTLAILVVVTGLCVLSWLAVLVVFTRDQLLARLADLRTAGGDPAVQEAAAQLRSELAEEQRTGLAAIEDRITALTSEYGDRRETDGYLQGMRAAAAGERSDIRLIRRAPTP